VHYYADLLQRIRIQYRSRLLCRGPQALGKASKALGKAFAERSSRQSALGKNPIGKGFFAESPTLGNARSKKMRKNLKKILIGGGAHCPAALFTRQVAAFFAQNSRLRGRRDSNS
jgi:hypothetical protein